MKFLAVDDSSTMRKIVSLALKGAGHEVGEAEHGKDALAKLEGNPVDCIILDINMPEMNGIEFLTARKTKPALAKIPVIVLTTQDETAMRDQAMELGANAFLGKPFQKEDLLASIKRLLGV
ncbi:MAG TPA: response regulator [Rectinemataceae bacterium]|nr:response regulator [Rectinemataceae bacterium]